MYTVISDVFISVACYLIADVDVYSNLKSPK